MNHRIIHIYDKYTNGYLDCRRFLKKLAFFTGDITAAYAMLSQQESNAAIAEVVVKDDPMPA
jgi:hypothetical protein